MQQDDVQTISFHDTPQTGNPVATIRILSGKYKGAEVPFRDGENIVVGRDVNKCNLIFAATTVSAVHCEIAFSHEERVFYVTDQSMNGTYTENIVTQELKRLEKGMSVRLEPDSVIVIGQDGERLKLQTVNA